MKIIKKMKFYEFLELSLRSCTSIDFELICPPQKFPDMERLDLYRTNITTECLECYLMYMPKLKHLNLGKLMFVLLNFYDFFHYNYFVNGQDLVKESSAWII